MVNGNPVHYAKGDCFAEAGSVKKYAGFLESGYFKYFVLTSKGYYVATPD